MQKLVITDPTAFRTDKGTPVGRRSPRPEIVVTFDADAAFWTGEGYQATEGGYDLDCTVGHGKTPLDAIVDLLDQLEN